VILLAKTQEAWPQARLRRIEVWSEERQETIVFLTNHLKLAATTVAAVYKYRWRIELILKALEQSLRLKTFVCTRPNSVSIRIRTTRTTGACPIWCRRSGSNSLFTAI
jgi:hypothetical protein